MDHAGVRQMRNPGITIHSGQTRPVSTTWMGSQIKTKEEILVKRNGQHPGKNGNMLQK